MCHQHRYWVDRTLCQKWLFIARATKWTLWPTRLTNVTTLFMNSIFPVSIKSISLHAHLVTVVVSVTGLVMSVMVSRHPALLTSSPPRPTGLKRIQSLESLARISGQWYDWEMRRGETVLPGLGFSTSPLRASIDGKQCNIHRVILRVTICKKLQLAQKVSRWQESGSMRM